MFTDFLSAVFHILCLKTIWIKSQINNILILISKSAAKNHNTKQNLYHVNPYVACIKDTVYIVGKREKIAIY